MKRNTFFIAYAALLLCFLLLVIALAESVEVKAIAPPVNTNGLCVYEMAEPEYELYFTEADVVALARMLYGEARGCTVDNQMKCVWCVLNRVDDPRFPDTIIGAVSASGQFYGYSPYNPVWDNLYAVALDVLTRWSMEKQGADVARELDESFVWFTGNGVENVFRGVYA